jgi:hypothetical protein
MDDGVWRDWDQEHVDRDVVACGAPEGRQSFVLREMGEITGLEQPEEDGIVVQRDRRYTMRSDSELKSEGRST